MPGGGQGSLGVGEGLLETMLIKHIFASTVYQRQGQAPARSAGEGIRNPNTAEDPAGPCSEQVYVTTLALGLSSTVEAQCPYHQLPPLGRGTSNGGAGRQGGQSFPPLLKDGDATPHPTRPPGPRGNHRDIGEMRPQERMMGDSQKCRSPFFPPSFHPQCRTKETTPASLTELATGPRELQGHHLMAKLFLRPRGCRV